MIKYTLDILLLLLHTSFQRSMLGGNVFADVLSLLNETIDTAPDPRSGSNAQYSMHDFLICAFAMLFMQSPSFLAFQRLMQQERGMNNAATLFAVHTIPTDAQIRNILDTLEPQLWRPIFRRVFQYLDGNGVIEPLRDFDNTLLIALDGTGYFHSESIHCPLCTVSNHRDGRVSYAHSVLMPAVVKPHHRQVIPLEPEFIVPQDGHKKQDCEREAVKRWIKQVGSAYSSRSVTLLGDDIYACMPIVRLALKERLHYIFVAKDKSHKHLYEEIASFEKLGEAAHVSETKREGTKKRTYHYRYVNDVALKDGAEDRRVNWAELTIINEAGKIVFHIAFVTDHRITDDNVAALIEAGRCRWKIENENFNTLKTKGYHFEHNFGHGKRYLSQTLLSLNMIAFLFHTVLEILDQRCALLRDSLPRRDTFFQHIGALTHYLCFASWQSLLDFMIRGIRDGPGPPPDPRTLIT